MKVAVAVCVALLAVVLVQAEDEMAPPVLAAATRIANGRPAAPREFPYMAWIVGSDDSGIVKASCGGSLVTRWAVLTAAYWCVDDTSKWTVRVGSNYREGEDPNSWTVESIMVTKHPKYNGSNLDNNIAIIHLPRLAPENEYIQPVSLPCSSDVSSYIGREGIVAGWGYTHPGSGLSDVLRWGEVLVTFNHYCKQFRPSHALTDRQLCAASFNATVFDGDAGAPLVFHSRGRYIQIGIFSFRTAYEVNTSHPVIYTRVTSFLDWIKLYTESD